MTDGQGRVRLVTGASSGFGLSIAEVALAAGDTVVVAVRRPDSVGGSDAFEAVGAHLERQTAELSAWEQLSRSADFPAG